MLSVKTCYYTFSDRTVRTTQSPKPKPSTQKQKAQKQKKRRPLSLEGRLFICLLIKPGHLLGG